MPAVKSPGLLVRARQPLPLLGGEREIHRPAVVVVGDQIARQLPMRERMLERVKHGALGAGRLQLDHAGEVEHRCAVLADLPVHQRHVVVRVMRGDPFDVRQFRREPAGPLHRLSREAQRLERIGALAPAGVEPFEISR